MTDRGPEPQLPAAEPDLTRSSAAPHASLSSPEAPESTAAASTSAGSPDAVQQVQTPAEGSADHHQAPPRFKPRSHKIRTENPIRAAHYEYVFTADYDDEGVYFYQAYSEEIGAHAVAHQTFQGCDSFNPRRMTWIKPSFGWVLYRSGYGTKPSQTRVLRVKLPHAAVALLLAQCKLSSEESGSAKGRVQWDPERDLYSSSDGGKEPRRLEKVRAIQIGLKEELSEYYVGSIIAVEDVTELARRVHAAHQGKLTAPPGDQNGGRGRSSGGGKKRLSGSALMEERQRQGMALLADRLPNERAYTPIGMSQEDMVRLRLRPNSGGGGGEAE